MIKKLFLYVLGILTTLCAFSQENSFELKDFAIDDFTIKLPSNCALSEELSDPDEGCFCMMTPDKEFLFLYEYFRYDESASQEEMLIANAAEFGIEVMKGNIAQMKLSDDAYLSMTCTSTTGIGVSKIYPEDKVGLYLFVYTPNLNDDGMTVREVMLSVRKCVNK